MSFTLTMPKLSPTMESGVIAKWHKKVGDHVKAGDVLFEVSTDKATVEYEALDDGYLRKIVTEEGDEAKVNDLVAIFTETSDGKIDEAALVKLVEQPAKEAPAKVAAAPTPTEPSKTATMAQPAFAPEPPLVDYSFSTPSNNGGRLFASPLARRLAKDKGLDLSTVQGTGPSGRIMSRDLELAQPAADVSFGSGKRPEIAPGTYEEEKVSPMRRVIAQRLQEAKTFIPHFYTRLQINAEALVAVREQLLFAGIKLSINDFIVRASALALRKHPAVNSAYNSTSNTIARYKTIDICIAVSVEAGLITPIIRHADFKTLGELSVEVKALATRAKAGKLELHEYKGGSFTISNLGMFGVDEFSAIINPPQAAILAVGAVLDVPVVRQGNVVPSKVMNLVLSADHRVVDGVEAAKFLRTIKSYLENPSVLLLAS